MNKSQLKARKTRIDNILESGDKRTTYEKQNERLTSDKYYDSRKRIE